jgi:cyanophycinase
MRHHPDSRRLRAGALLLALLALIAARAGGGGAAAASAGAVVAVGGGGTPPAVLARALELAGGARARVLVLPQASQRPEAGEEAADMWRQAGAAAVEVLHLDPPEAARAAIARADLLWMGGGSQERLLDALESAGLVEVLRARHAEGAVVGGTSAGAAVLGERALTGEAELERISAKTTATRAGLGLVRGALFDQHTLARRRLNRSLAVTLDHPHLLGVAVDERTAAVLREGRIEVLGESSVAIIDARAARMPELQPGEPSAATGVTFHLLRAGMSLPLGGG